MLEATVADLLQDVRYWYGTFFCNTASCLFI